MKSLVLGLGNPSRCDDGVGVAVARQLAAGPLPAGVEVQPTCEAGPALLDLLAGCQRLIVVDAVRTEGGRPGDIYEFPLAELVGRPGADCAHNAQLPALLALGVRLGLPMPREGLCFAVEAARLDEFGEGLTPAVAEAVPRVAERIRLRLS
ncbi:MAG: hydrogenase maturation protease [Elusimicrobia bacterium]|nr:hydrogenase maturation protease [Elusimicrobiota bacterium]